MAQTTCNTNFTDYCVYLQYILCCFKPTGPKLLALQTALTIVYTCNTHCAVLNPHGPTKVLAHSRQARWTITVAQAKTKTKTKIEDQATTKITIKSKTCKEKEEVDAYKDI